MKVTDVSLEYLNKLNEGTLMNSLHIEYTKISEGKVAARMPVCSSTCQPEGILHGGASLALAETVAGLGSMLLIDTDTHAARGSQVSCNHVGSVSKGDVIAEAEIIHQGRHTHVWNINIVSDTGRLVSTCRVTNVIIKK